MSPNPKTQPKTLDLAGKVQAIVRAEARAKRAYKVKDAMLAASLLEAEAGDVVEIGKRKYVLKHNAPKEQTKIFRTVHVPLYKWELVKA